MRSVLKLFVLGAFTASASACSSPSEPGGKVPAAITALPRALSPAELSVVGANNVFAATLFSAVNASRLDSNVFISPLSASMALGMTMNGANGTTLDEMRSALGFGASGQSEVNASYKSLIALLRTIDPKVDFRIANSIWARKEFAPLIAPTFVSEAKDYFDASVTPLDFASAAAPATINAWVSANTNGKIDKIINSLSSDDVLVLINAIYFKGDWRSGFDKAKTKSESFVTERGTSRQVPMMHQVSKMRLGTVSGRTVVELGYGGDAYAMTILLPAPDESVNALVGGMSAALWQSVTTSLVEREVDLTMPRLKLAWEGFLNTPLQAMGMRAAFGDGNADFSRLAPPRGAGLFISYVKQNTFVDVNEKGTEAAAATAVVMTVTSAPSREVVRIDRPFVFAIRERLSGTVLFLGKIVEPPAS